MTDIVDLLRSGEFLETQLTGNGHSFISTSSPSVRKAADTIEALRAENARLRAALKPFADKANKAEQPFAPPYPEDYPLWRAARAALEKKND